MDQLLGSRPLWLKDSLGDRAKWERKFADFISPGTVATWVKSWLRLEHGAFPKIANGRHREIISALKKAGKKATLADLDRAGVKSADKTHRKSNRRPPADASSIRLRNQDTSIELPNDGAYSEGSVVTVFRNAYERDPKARKACLAAFGNTYMCEICKTNFIKRYGQIGKHFIHVHHRTPLALRRTKYEPNPAKDLVPVCPNCHAMLHYGRPWHQPRSAKELRGIWNKLNKD